MEDPGRPLRTFQDRQEGGGTVVVQKRAGYSHSTIMNSGRLGEDTSFALSFVRGLDMSAIDDDPEIETVIGDILDGGERKMLDQTPNNRGMGAAEKTDLRAALVAKGTVLDALDDDTPLRDWLAALGKRVSTDCHGDCLQDVWAA